MTEKRYIKENFYDEYAIKKEDTIIAIVDSGTNARKICNELNTLYEENEQLKKELREEQYRTTPITLTTTISDDDFKKIELMLKKYFGDLE